MRSFQSIQNLLSRAHLNLADFFVALTFLPIIIVLALDSYSFFLGWNEGRGGLLFGLLFFIIEWMDVRNQVKLKLSSRRIVLWSLCVIGYLAYFSAVYLFELQEGISYYGEGCGITESGLLSWTWLWEYVIFGVVAGLSVIILFGGDMFKQVITPVVYAGGSAGILLLDALFPYQSLGFLANLVPFIVSAVVFLLGLSGVHISDTPFGRMAPPWVFVQENYLLMNGNHGFVVLEINWPCAGILSMLVYILVVIILMVKLEAPAKRKIAYLSIGSVGTFLINIIRIYLITLAVAYWNIDLRVFHESIGEVLFVIWIVLYLVTVVQLESMMRTRKAITQGGEIKVTHVIDHIENF